MTQFQVRKDDFTTGRLVDGPSMEGTIGEGEILVKIDTFAYTANNITYAVVGERIGYWQFFPPIGEDTEGWGVIPIWGFAEVVESHVSEIPVGDRLFGYFSPSTYLKMRPTRVSDARFVDGATHRQALPAGYNLYRRVHAEPNYSQDFDRERMMLFPLYLTAFCIWDAIQDKNWYKAKEIILLSASSKTSIGLAYALHEDKDAPSVTGITSPRNADMVRQLGVYDTVRTYDQLEDVHADVPTVIVDMSGNGEVLAKLHTHLGDNMKWCINVGITHWEQGGGRPGIIRERSEFFFAPAHIQKRLKEWGPDGFEKKTAGFMIRTATKTRDWLSFKELNGLTGLAAIHKDVADGKIAAHEGLVVKL